MAAASLFIVPPPLTTRSECQIKIQTINHMV